MSIEEIREEIAKHSGVPAHLLGDEKRPTQTEALKEYDRRYREAYEREQERHARAWRPLLDWVADLLR